MNPRVRIAVALACFGLAGPVAAQTITLFPIPAADNLPNAIAVGPDGNMWFTAESSIGRITPAGVITEFPIPKGLNALPVLPAIAAGPDGNMWFTVSAENRIGRITMSGVITEFLIPTALSFPSGIAAGSDGNLWFTEAEANQIGRITTGGVFTEFPIPTAGSFLFFPGTIAAGPDGNLWFTEPGSNKIFRITTSGVITEFPMEAMLRDGIAAGPDGNLWFTGTDFSEQNKYVGRITMTGVVTVFPVPDYPVGIAAGWDGKLWFTEGQGTQIGRITTGGVVTEFPIPAEESQVGGIAAGPDGNLWFAKFSTIGRVTTPPCNSDATVPCIESGQVALDISAGAAGETHLLYSGAGSSPAMTLDPSGFWTTAGFNTPLADFNATAIADGLDGRSCILWQNADGRGHLEIVGPSLHETSNFTSPPGWTALDLSVGAQIHLLWTNGTGQMRITSNRLLDMTEGPTYGPYGGWSASAIADGPDGATWVLWRHSDGRAGVARYRDGTFETAFRWSASAGWSAQDIAVGTDGRPRVLWTDTDGRMGIGTVDDQGQLFDRKAYTSVGQRARRIAASPDGLTRVLWTGVDRGGSLWLLNPDNSIKSELATPEHY